MHLLGGVRVSETVIGSGVGVVVHEAIELNQSAVQSFIYRGPAWDDLHRASHCFPSFACTQGSIR